MSHLVVVTFDNPDEAGQVRETLRSAERADYLSLDDSAVVVKDEDGKIHVKNELDRGVTIGAVGGGLLGLLIGGIFFPVAGLLVGAIAGGLIGSSADLGIQKQFVKQVEEDLKPGTSAIFFVVRDANPDVALAALKPYKGNVYHTSFPPEAEEELRRILSKRF
ncbi:MAG TPA: DUF1269 domain-containing protein [Anaerolineae bacterium]|nr:DUF1269 domain-containing protein [Anaerolineae bacterium]